LAASEDLESHFNETWQEFIGQTTSYQLKTYWRQLVGMELFNQKLCRE
jgi:hypothetical protein